MVDGVEIGRALITKSIQGKRLISLRVILLNTFYFPREIGGAERSVRLLAEALKELGHEVLVVCLDEIEKVEVVNGVTVRSLSVQNVYLPDPNGSERSKYEKFIWHLRDTRNFRAAEKFEAVLLDFMPEVVHTNNLSGFSTEVWKRCSALSIPVVHTTRDFYLLCHRTTMLKGTLSCGRQCLGCAPLSCIKGMNKAYVSHFVAISDFMRRKHLEHNYFINTPSSVIYNSIEFSDLREIGRPNSFTLGFIGRLDAAKGVEMLIETLRELLPIHKNLSLVIAGTGKDSYIEHLKQIAAGLPVTFLGKTSPEHFFSLIDLTVVPSLWEEPLGRVVIESMSFGRPVVVSPVGGLRELADGVSVIEARDTTVDSFVGSIHEFINVLKIEYDVIAEAAVLRAKNFSGKVIAEYYVGVYESVRKRDLSLPL